MKSFLLLLFLSIISEADCPAPDLLFSKYEGSIHQFIITSVMEVPEDMKSKEGVYLFPIGDYTFLLKPDLKQKFVPQKVEVSKLVSRKISSSFKSSPHYLDGIKQTFELISTEGLDLDGDKNSDVVLFQVSPGGNVYSGAVLIKGKEFFTLIEPSCY